MLVDSRRVRQINSIEPSNGPVIYWMSRDQRVHDNWTLLYAQELAFTLRQPLIVVFCLVPKFLEATIRHYDFMLQGLKEVENELTELRIPFLLKLGQPTDVVPEFARQVKAGAVVTDFDPLRIKRSWVRDVSENLSCAFYEVDAHNVVPCWIASSKQEFGAYTLRPKIHKMLDDFLSPFPKVSPQQVVWVGSVVPFDWKHVQDSLQVRMSVRPVDWIEPGEAAARKALTNFVEEKLAVYNAGRNNPTLDHQSGMSPYLHFGQIAAARIALEVRACDVDMESKKALLEELLVRKELSDNFCYYNPQYDSFSGFPRWAQESLNIHRTDQREFIYSQEEFEQARTHDDLWNAAQLEMVQRGKMHGYMRMYWAKKILEWSESPEKALKIAIYLNDTYELDGRDPNGYTGIAWSIGGLHDRAWFDRPIYGKIRYMSYNGAKSKFKVKEYIERYHG